MSNETNFPNTEEDGQYLLSIYSCDQNNCQATEMQTIPSMHIKKTMERRKLLRQLAFQYPGHDTSSHTWTRGP